MLLLDEAMAGLTPAEVRSAIELVRQIHDRHHARHRRAHHGGDRSLANRVIVFHQGREIARGTPREVTSNERVIEAYLGRRQARQIAGGKA